jgi:hypothetical protein
MAITMSFMALCTFLKHRRRACWWWPVILPSPDKSQPKRGARPEVNPRESRTLTCGTKVFCPVAGGYPEVVKRRTKDLARLRRLTGGKPPLR